MVRVVDSAHGVRTITLLEHALEPELVDALTAALHVPETVRCVCLAGGSEVFCSGASEGLLADLHAGRRQPTELLLPRAILDCAVPVVGVAEGHAIGGGLALLACCDMALIAHESRYGATFVELGFTPGMGSTALLEHFLPAALAWEMLFTGRRYKGRELAAHWPGAGPRVELMARAEELCWSIAAHRREVLLPLRAHLVARRRASFEQARGAEILMHSLTFGTPPSGVPQ